MLTALADRKTAGQLETRVQVLTASGRSLDDTRQKQFDKIRNIVKNIKDIPGV